MPNLYFVVSAHHLADYGDENGMTREQVDELLENDPELVGEVAVVEGRRVPFKLAVIEEDLTT